MTSERPEPNQGDTPSPAAIAATEHPVQITVGLIEDERVPDGMVCMGSYRNGRLVARAVLPPEAWGQISEFGIFDEPVQIVLVARAAPPGLQCQLYAMVPLPDDDDEPEEPWSASVPGSSYEASMARRRRRRTSPPATRRWPRSRSATSCATSATGCTPRACRSRRWTCCGGSSMGIRRR